MDSVLVAGLNCRPVALSAKRLGLTVYVVDFFGDVDLKSVVDKVYSIEGEYDSAKIVDKAVEVAESVEPDALLLTSEVGCNPDYVEKLEPYNVVGNSSRQVKKVRDWSRFHRKLDELGVSYPKTFIVKNVRDAKRAVDTLGSPFIVKPIHGSAGFGVEIADDIPVVEKSLAQYGSVLIQEFVEGEAASVSALGTGSDALAISFNRQLLGQSFLGCTKSFQYCGNTVPFNHDLECECKRMAELIGSEFGLQGSYGVDFALADKPYVIEVNPRFQDTLECIEKTLNINLVESHIEALAGKLPDRFDMRGTCSKGILYARNDMTIQADLTMVSDCVDIYPVGTEVSEGMPVCSAFGHGTSEEESYNNLKIKIWEIKQLLS